MAQEYPEGYPCPQVTPYGLGVDMGVVRTPMAGGHFRQRRLYTTMPTLFELEFIMDVPTLGQWQAWVNEYAYDAIRMNLAGAHASAGGQVTAPIDIRFTSPLEVGDFIYGYVRARVEAEALPVVAAPTAPPWGW